LSLIARIGLYSWDIDAVLFGENIGSDNGTDVTYGVGLGFKVADDTSIQVEYKRYDDISGGNVDTIHAGVNVGF
jgi:hypothetical protein